MDALTTELCEVKTMLEGRRETELHSWTEVVKVEGASRTVAKPTGPQNSHSVPTVERAAAPGRQQAKKSGGGRVPSARSSEPSTKSAQRTPVDGVRRVWGTLKSTTAAVRSTLKKLWPVSNSLIVRRRVREYGDSNKTRWWFILKGDENTLKTLDNECQERIQMQTNLKLEQCTAPNNQPSANNSNPGESSSLSPENVSTNSTSDAATSLGTTVVTRPNQVPNSQTVSIDVNSASPSDSQDQSDDEGTQGSNPQQSTGSILILDSGQLAET